MTRRDAMLSPTQRIPLSRARQELKDKIFEIWRGNTDESGILTFTLRTVHRLPPGSFPTLGYQVHTRSPNARPKLIHHIDLRRGEPTAMWEFALIALAKLYEKTPPSCEKAECTQPP